MRDVSSRLSFLENKLNNSLDEHLPLVVACTLKSIFTLEDFPYANTFDMCMGSVAHVRYDV